MMCLRSIRRGGLLMTAAAATCLVAIDAEAFWGSRGSFGSYGSAGSHGSYGSAGSHGSTGSYGSYGSAGSHGSYSVSYASSGSYGSTGSYGSYGSAGSHGSHGPGPLKRLAAHIRAKRAARASYGSYGSAGSHGSTGSYGSTGSHGGYSYSSTGSHGSSGSHGSTGSHGSYGGGSVIYSHASKTAVAKPVVVASNDASGSLQVSVPADAVVYVNDHKTTSTGVVRNYVSNGLKQGAAYKYRVRVEYDVNGKTVTETKVATVIGGGSADLEFGDQPSLATSPAPETKLTLSVPADASVTLAGAATGQGGAEREYTTTKLPAGASWDNYVVEVTVGGQTQERTINLVGGESQHLVFDFADAAKLAAR